MILSQQSKKIIHLLFLVIFITILGVAAGTTTVAAQTADITVDAGGGSDYTSIQNAVDNATDTDVIEIKSGTYYESVLISKNVTLTSSEDATVKNSSTGTFGFIITDAAAPKINGIEFVDWETTIDASNSKNGGTISNIAISDSTTGLNLFESESSWSVSDSSFKNVQFGVSGYKSTGNWRVDNSTFIDGEKGVSLQEAGGDVLITNTTISNLSNKGIDAEAITGVITVSNVGVNSVGGSGIDIDDSTGNWTVNNTQVSDTGDSAIDAGNTSADGEIINTNIQNSTFHGIEIEKSTGSWMIQSTTVTNVSGDGVDAYQSDGGQIQNITITDTGSNGINLYNADGDWRVENSTIDATQSTGINSGDGNRTSSPTITNSTIHDADEHGIGFYNSSADWVVSGVNVTNVNQTAVEAGSTNGQWNISESILTTGSGTAVDAVGADRTGNASYNYWGANDGPSGDFNGSGAQAVGNISVSPAYTDTSLAALTQVGKSSTTAASGINSVAADDATADGSTAKGNYTASLDEAIQANVTLNFTGDFENLTAEDGHITNTNVVTGSNVTAINASAVVNGNAIVKTNSDGKVDLAVTFNSSVQESDVFNASIDAADPNVSTTASKDTAFSVDTTSNDIDADSISSITTDNPTASAAPASGNYTATLNEAVQANVTLSLTDGNLIDNDIISVDVIDGSAANTVDNMSLVNGNATVRTTNQGELDVAVKFESGVNTTDTFNATINGSDTNISADDSANQSFFLDTFASTSSFNLIGADDVSSDGSVNETYTVELDEQVQANVTFGLGNPDRANRDPFESEDIAGVEITEGTNASNNNSRTVTTSNLINSDVGGSSIEDGLIVNGSTVTTNDDGNASIKVTYSDVATVDDNIEVGITELDTNVSLNSRSSTPIQISTAGATNISSVTAEDPTADGTSATGNYTATLNESVQANVTLNLTDGNLSASNITDVSVINGTTETTVDNTSLVNGNAVVNTTNQGELDVAVTFASGVNASETFNASINSSDTTISADDSLNESFFVDTTAESTSTANSISSITADSPTTNGTTATGNYTVELNESVQANVTLNFTGDHENLTTEDGHITNTRVINGTNVTTVNASTLVDGSAVVKTDTSGELDLAVTFNSSVNESDVFNASIAAADPNVSSDASNEAAFSVNTVSSAATLTGTDIQTLAGTNATFEFALENTGDQNSSYILNLTVPDNWTPVAYSDDGGDRQSGEVKWLWQTIEPDETVNPTVTVEVPERINGSYTVTGEALTNESVVAQATATASVLNRNVTASIADQTLANGSETSVTVDAPLSNGTFVNVTENATFSSNDTAVATVGANGTVTATGTGTATINTTYEGENDSVTVTVTPADVEQAIDVNNDGEIDDIEILNAIDYWQQNTAVPRTDGKKIGDFEILDLIAKWRYNTQL